MAKIPIDIQVSTKILMENGPPVEQKFIRGYLGFSAIGDDCSRKLWYGFRFASRRFIAPRLKRIFERGDMEEARVIRDLKEIGAEIYRVDGDGNKIELTGEIGEQQEEFIGFFGHALGHPDGRILGIPEAPKTEHLLEIKTMNDARFKNFQKNGIKISDPKYYDQVQRGMKASKITRTLFVVTNKNNEERDYERVKYEPDRADMLESKERDIICSDAPPGKFYSTRNHFECKRCNHFGVCWDNEAPVVTCRSCEHVDLATEGQWVCTKKDDKILSKDDQLTACRSYKRLF